MMTSQKPVDGIILDKSMGPLSNQYLKTLAIDSPEQFIQQVKGDSNTAKKYPKSCTGHMYYNSSNCSIVPRIRLHNIYNRVPPLPFNFPQHDFAQQMHHAARLIASGVDVPIYKVGFKRVLIHMRNKVNNTAVY